MVRQMGLCQSKKDDLCGEPIIVINNDNQSSAITEIDLTKRRIVVIRGAHGTVSTAMITQLNNDAERREVSFSL